MKHEFTYVELSDEQLELVVGGCHHSRRSRQVGVAANFGGNNAFNLQNANVTNQAGFITVKFNFQKNINIIIQSLSSRPQQPTLKCLSQIADRKSVEKENNEDCRSGIPVKKQ